MIHQILSFIKSFVRIIGFIFLITDLTFGVIILCVAELIGIAEEL